MPGAPDKGLHLRNQTSITTTFDEYRAPRSAAVPAFACSMSERRTSPSEIIASRSRLPSSSLIITLRHESSNLFWVGLGRNWLVRACLLCAIRGVTGYHVTLQLRYQSVLVYD
jgi:hypothetical protein